MTRQFFGRWLSLAHFDNSVVREQAALVQNLLLVLLIVTVVGMPLSFVMPQNTIYQTLGSLVLTVSSVVSLLLIRRGKLRPAVLVISCGLLIEVALIIVPNGVITNGFLISALIIPLMLASICAGRTEAITVAVVGILILILLSYLQFGTDTNIVGFAPPAPGFIPVLIGVTAIILFVLIAFLDRFRNAFNEALLAAALREQALTEAQSNLERLVSERTSQLEMALHESERREIRLRETLHALESSEQTVAALSSPVIPVAAGVLAAPLIGVLDTGRVDQAAEFMLQAVRDGKAQFLILDVTGVPVVDTEAAEGILRIARSIRLLGAQAILTGIHPEIAQTLVAIGFDQDHFVTRSTLQEGISYALLSAARRSNGARPAMAPGSFV